MTLTIRLNDKAQPLTAGQSVADLLAARGSVPKGWRWPLTAPCCPVAAGPRPVLMTGTNFTSLPPLREADP